MTAIAREVLAAFDALPTVDQQHVAIEIIRRSTSAHELPEAALDELAGELFRAYDAEEAARAEP